MQALIIAAGLGSRLNSRRVKPLVRIGSRSLLAQSIWQLFEIGIREFVIMLGYQAEHIKTFFTRRQLLLPECEIVWVENPDYRRGNGLSVLCARPHLGEHFLVSMVDHIFDPHPLRQLPSLRGDLIAVVDSMPRFVDPDEATRVLVRGDRIKRIGKGLKQYNALDCGLFVCSQRIFPALTTMIAQGKDTWNDAKQRLARESVATVYDLKGNFWCDVDTPEDLANAEILMRAQNILQADIAS